eukprot:scaffold519381_cov48-Prasinocladus_malaysianus.AAC.1
MHHEATGTSINFNAFDALREWHAAKLAPVRVAGSNQWLATRRREVEMSNATYLEYDWTFTTPYAGSVYPSHPSTTAESRAFNASGPPKPGQLKWVDTDHRIDRQMLMARDPILLYDE